MVFNNGFAPFTEPGQEWRDHASAVFGMTMEHLPLSFIGGAGFVEQRRRHLDLANVVKQCGPAQPRLAGGIDLQLLREKVSEHANALRMPARSLVMHAQREDQLDH